MNGGRNPGTDGDFSALRPARVAFAVESRMVMQDVQACQLQPGQYPENCPAVFRMLLHQRVLILVQTSGLVQDRIGYAYLADIVQERGHFDVMQARLFDAHLLSNTDGPLGASRAVNPRAQVLRV